MIDWVYLPYASVHLTPAQFEALAGFAHAPAGCLDGARCDWPRRTPSELAASLDELTRDVLVTSPVRDAGRGG